MSDPRAELRPAVREALRSDAGLQTIFAAAFGSGAPVKVYDIPPVNAVTPYLTIAAFSLQANLAECIDGAEVAATIESWTLTDPPGRAQGDAIDARVIAVLLGLGDLPSHRVTNTQLTLARDLTEPDGRTTHGIVTVQVNTQPTT